MQILYGTAMAAIFMLCLVLFWTARRILRSSPITSGAELSLTRLNEVIERIDVSTESTKTDYAEIDYAETDYADISKFDIEPEVAEISTNLLNPIALEMMASASDVANEVTPPLFAAQLQEPVQAFMETPAPPQMDVTFEAADMAADPETNRSEKLTKHLPHGYNYLLEGLLLGVSVFVLIRTQKSNWRYQRSLRSSNQVA